MRRAVTALGAALVLVPSASWSADCTVQWRSLAAMLSTAELIEPGPDRPVRSSGPGVCTVSDVTLLPGEKVSYRLRVLSWSGEGVDRFLADGTPPSSFSLRLQGARAVAAEQGGVEDWIVQAYGTSEPADLRITAIWDWSGRFLIDAQDLGRLAEPSVWADMVIDGVDLSSSAAAKASAASFSIRALKASIGMNDAFTRLVLTGLTAEHLRRSEDPETDFPDLVERARDASDELPDAVFPVHSRVALKALLSDLPAPEGRLVTEITASNGFGAANLLPLLVRRTEGGLPLQAALSGLRFDLRYDR